MAQNIPTHLIKIPIFDPKKGLISPRAWVSAVESARESAGRGQAVNGVPGAFNWSEQMTSNNAQNALQGIGSQWIQNFREDNDQRINTWTTFKVLFLDRFEPPPDISHKAQIMSKLKQSSSESVYDFRDRVIADTRTLWRNFPEPDANATEAVKAENARCRRWVANEVSGIVIANGLDNSIKDAVNNQPCANLEGLIENAVRVESNVTRKHSVPAATVTVNEIEGNVSAVKVKAPANNGPRNQGSRPQSQRPRFTGKCFYCQRIGHTEARCFQKRDGKPRVASVEAESGPAEPQSSKQSTHGDEVGYLEYESLGNSFAV